MNMISKKILWMISAVLLLSYQPAFAQEVVIPLYKGKAPGSEKWNWKEVQTQKSGSAPSIAFNIADPTLTVFKPAAGKSTGAGIVLAPGGGFFLLSVQEEGSDVAKWLNNLGVTVFMLKYRTVRTEDNNPMAGLFSLFTKDSTATWKKMNEVSQFAGQDGLKAMEYVRSHSKEYNLDENKLGLLGFSAGGSVVLSVLYQAEEKNRPNFAAAIYASDLNKNNGSAPNYKVPIFLAAASDDMLGLAPVSISTYEKWQKAKQSAELHIYEKGGHGFALKKQNLPSDAWAKSFEDWLRFNKIIPSN